MKKFVVLGEKWSEKFRKSLPFHFHVKANNKMDAVRSFKDVYGYDGNVRISWSHYAEKGQEYVWEYVEPVFKRRCDDFD